MKLQFGGENIPKKKTQKKPYPITITDWIIYLEGSSSTNISLLVFVGSIFIIGIIGFVETSRIYNFPLIGTLLITLFLLIVFIFVNMKIQRVTEPYQKLSERIVRGEITEPKKILEEYDKIKERGCKMINHLLIV